MTSQDGLVSHAQKRHLIGVYISATVDDGENPSLTYSTDVSSTLAGLASTVNPSSLTSKEVLVIADGVPSGTMPEGF